MVIFGAILDPFWDQNSLLYSFWDPLGGVSGDLGAHVGPRRLHYNTFNTFVSPLGAFWVAAGALFGARGFMLRRFFIKIRPPHTTYDRQHTQTNGGRSPYGDTLSRHFFGGEYRIHPKSISSIFECVLVLIFIKIILVIEFANLIKKMCLWLFLLEGEI